MFAVKGPFVILGDAASDQGAGATGTGGAESGTEPAVAYGWGLGTDRAGGAANCA
jgi:hypothetical protein